MKNHYILKTFLQDEYEQDLADQILDITAKTIETFIEQVAQKMEDYGYDRNRNQYFYGVSDFYKAFVEAQQSSKDPVIRNLDIDKLPVGF